MSFMPVKGYAGKYLRVNLTEGSLVDEVYDESTLRRHLGGTGVGAKVLYEEAPKDIEFMDPRNVAVIASGPLGGTSVGGSGTISIVTKGALTGGATSVQANGLFGAYMKFSGYDGVILTGAAPEWRYLVLREEGTELRDASKFVGRDTYEVTDGLREEHSVAGRGASVLSIGPAGENLVRWAGVFVDHGHSASHNGPGAVLGSKKLKAIISFRGTGRMDVHDPEALREVSEEMYDDVTYFRGTIGGVERMYKGGSGALPVKNYSTYDWGIEPEELDTFNAKSVRDRYQKKMMQCWGCRLLHSTMFEVKEGRYAGEVEEPEYEQMAAWGPVIGNTDVEAAFMLSGLTDRLGLDNNEAGWMVGWIMECMEKGFLTEDQVGFRTGWGDAEGAAKILRMAAYREGFGDILAEGVRRASMKIGGQAAEAAVYTMKGNTPRGHDHRYRWAEMFDTCVSNTGTIETHMSVMSPAAQGPENPMEVSGEVARTKGLMQLEDSVGTCRFNTRMNAERIARAVSAATGWDMTTEEAWDVGRRTVNLLRAFNLQAGITAEHDRPSTRYGDPETGVPLRETLENLGLGEVSDDLAA